MKNSKLHTTEDKSNEKVTSSNSKSEDTPEPYTPHRIGLHSDDRPYSGEPLCYCDKPQDTSLTKITAEYFMATDPDRVALQRKVLAWHKAEIAKLFEQIRSEAVRMNIPWGDGNGYDVVKAIDVEVLTKMEEL